MKYKLRRDVLYLLLRLFSVFILILPFRMAVSLGRWTGWLVCSLFTRVRGRVEENLSIAFGKDKEDPWIKETTKGVFENMGRSLMEILSFPKINKDNINSIVEATGLEKIDRVLEGGKGAIMLASHLGNWELLACYASLKGYKSNVVARRLYYHRYDRLLNNYRTSKGTGVFYRDASAKHLLKILKENQILGVLPDQDVDSLRGIFVDFFNRPAYTPIGPVSLSLASGAPIVPCFLIRTEKGHKMIVEDPIDVKPSGDKEKDIRGYTEQWSRIVESYIRKYPQQWVWMHDRWKTKPDNIQ